MSLKHPFQTKKMQCKVVEIFVPDFNQISIFSTDIYKNCTQNFGKEMSLKHPFQTGKKVI